jgi:predicted metal-binding transcription factor (methanogenesis marker protein 9)
MIYDLQINMNGAAFPEVLTVLRETELVSCLRACNGEFVVCCRISRDCQLGRQTDGLPNEKQQKVRMCDV